MSSAIIYKQSFKSRTDPSTPGLNVRHLQYIATRPGAVYNQGCGFGLWGQLPGEGGIRIQTDLERAKQLVREASQNHTLYRAILSVGKEDAQDHGLYHRDRWEQLVNDHIQVIAREMDIKPEDLCWCASMHYAKNHPHVHILYWDNGSQPRQDFITKGKFKEKAEHIRAEFAGAIHREEIRELQQSQRQQQKELRSAIQSMCREANPEKALSLPRLYQSGHLNSISEHLEELLRQLPTKGSLRYAYLPPDYKLLVDRLIDRCLSVPELTKELENYESATRQISVLYSNGEASVADAVSKANDKLHKELGNEVMEAIRVLKAELEADHPEDLPQARSYIQEVVEQTVPTLESYEDLRWLVPEDGAPLPDYYETLNKVIGDILSDARVQIRLQSYALDAAGIDLESKPAAPRKKAEADIGTHSHYFRGKLLSREEWVSYQSAYREVQKILRDTINRELMGDLRTNLLGSPEIRTKLNSFAHDMVQQIVPDLDSYKMLKELLPLERIPIKCMEAQITGYHDTMNKVVGDVLYDARVRLRLQTYALELAGVDLDACPPAADGEDHVLHGKALADEEWQSYQDAYREAKREIRRSITDWVRQDAGWTEEAQQTASASILCSMMHIISQAAHQRKAGAVQARNSLKTMSKDKSREAKRDYWATQSQGSEWDDGYC